jgi:DNA-binding response OmpR family regulator
MAIKNNDKQRILLVDDESDITTALKMYLELQGFHVDAFTDPVNALAQFKAGFYQLLILDIKMPEMNGFELYTEIKKKDDTIKVFFLTALSESESYMYMSCLYWYSVVRLILSPQNLSIILWFNRIIRI